MTDPIKAKIQELCPDVETLAGGCKECGPVEKPITLAVVLRAIAEAEGKMCAVDENGYFMVLEEVTDETCVYSKVVKGQRWNLTKDNYDDQTEETKRFIDSLLGV